MKKAFFFLFFFCIGLFAKAMPDSTGSQAALMSDVQKSVLYEFAVLQKNGSDASAYWQKNKHLFPSFSDSVRNKLADEIFTNSHIVYTAKKNSAIQLWMQTQSLTNWMLYLATFVAICAVVGLLRNYWNAIIKILIKQFEPLFKILFSEILLTYELLLIGIASIVLGCLIKDYALRTVTIHLGIFFIWGQSTALFTGKYLVKKYIFEIKGNFLKNDAWEITKTICLPATMITAAILYALYKVPEDKLYNYEIVITALTAIYALPFWRPVEKHMSCILIPYEDPYVGKSIYSLAACTVLALFINAILIWQFTDSLPYTITSLTTLLIISFLILSLKAHYKYNYKNYYYLQCIAALFFVFILLYSFYIHTSEMIWVSLVGACIFILIKYWEILSFFFRWRRKDWWAWGFFGMAALLWLLAKGILYISKYYISVE